MGDAAMTWFYKGLAFAVITRPLCPSDISPASGGNPRVVKVMLLLRLLVANREDGWVWVGRLAGLFFILLVGAVTDMCLIIFGHVCGSVAKVEGVAFGLRSTGAILAGLAFDARVSNGWSA